MTVKFLLCFLGLIPVVFGYQEYAARIPNGDKVPDPTKV